MKDKDPHRYDDIIGLPHFVSKNRRRMSNYDRAAQFAPFAALTGYHERIFEAARETDQLIGKGEDEALDMDFKLNIIAQNIALDPLIKIRYFVPDQFKEGGSYAEEEFHAHRIDLHRRVIRSTDKKEYDLDYIVDIESDLFDDLNI